jgi:hypothetical protein
MRKLVYNLIKIIIVIGTVILIFSGYSAYLSKQISVLYEEKRDAVSIINGEPVKDKGNILIQQSAKYHDLMVLGSSELSAQVPQNIKYDFPNTKYQYNISAMGHAYVQNMLHAMNIGANSKSFVGTDVVLVESMQWFFGEDSSPDGFMSNFSELQFYEFLNNSKILRKNKEYLCHRFLEMERRRTQMVSHDEIIRLANGNRVFNFFGITKLISKKGGVKEPTINYDYPQTHLLAKLYLSENIVEKFGYIMMKPYYYLRSKLMLLKDKYETYHYLKHLDGSFRKNMLDANWQKQLQKAEQDGKEECTNNNIFVYDDYYTSHVKDNWNAVKNSNVGVTALNSKEWEDFKFMLSVCNNLDIKPYLINVSCNAYYYDYTGLDPKMRQRYYSKIVDLANQHDIPTYSELRDMEYEPYVFADVMHLGWKGWIYVAQAITEHFQ